MELRIFNSILFNELRPWQPENLIDLSFIDKLRQIDDSFPTGANWTQGDGKLAVFISYSYLEI